MERKSPLVNFFIRRGDMQEERNVPVIPDLKTLTTHLRDLYVLDFFMTDTKTYEKFIFEIRDIVCAVFSNQKRYSGKFKLREYPIKFKFYATDKETHTIQLRHFLTNLYLWFPFCDKKLQGINILDESFILQPEDVPKLTDFQNKKIIAVLQDYNVKQRKINTYISTVNHLLISISIDLSSIMNLTFSEVDFIYLFKHPVYSEILTRPIPEDLQPVEKEEIINGVMHDLIEALKKDKTHPFGIILRAGTGMKDKQLIELLFANGLKPSIDGEVMPVSIDRPLLIDGLHKPSYMYIDAIAARKPLIMNYKSMGTAGYFGKVMTELAQTVTMDTTENMCDTEHLVPYEIKSKGHLNHLVGKYYILNKDESHYRILKDTDTDLIGTTIFTRSAITCAASQNTVCPCCIGSTSHLLFDIAKGIGVFFAEEISKTLQQNILSSKHLLTTKSERIEFTKEFYEYFKLTSGEISILNRGDDVNIDNIAIKVNPELIAKKEEYDNDSTFNTYLSTGEFQIVNKATGEAIDVKLLESKELYIDTEVAGIMRANNGIVDLANFDDSKALFHVIILNNELTKPLYNLMQLLDKDEKSEMELVDIEHMAQKVLDILVEAKIGAPMLAAELILNRLVRRKDDVTRRPNFSNRHLEAYKFFTITKCMEHNGSPLVGLGFENLKRQMLDKDLYNRNDTSFVDACFKETVWTSEIKKYSKSSKNFIDTY